MIDGHGRCVRFRLDDERSNTLLPNIELIIRHHTHMSRVIVSLLYGISHTRSVSPSADRETRMTFIGTFSRVNMIEGLLIVQEKQDAWMRVII